MPHTLKHAVDTGITGASPRPFTEEAPTPTPDPAAQCRLDGGRWDEATQRCIFPPKEEEVIPEQERDVKLSDEEKANLPAGANVITDIFGNERIQTREEANKAKGTAELGVDSTSKEDIQARAAARREGAALAGQVGEFGQLGIGATPLDFEQAAISATISSIPAAIRLGATAGLGIGALGGTAVFPGIGTTVGATAGAAIGAGAGFIAGIVGGMTSNLASQRRDNTTAQQRTLDEGKQTMKDWATLATNDPANKARYLAEYNKVSAQINQAYRQMKLDTSEDVAKFETALPNLAEFESFYAAGGERDALDVEMRNALTSISPENYEMLELAHRRGNNG